MLADEFTPHWKFEFYYGDIWISATWVLKLKLIKIMNIDRSELKLEFKLTYGDMLAY